MLMTVYTTIGFRVPHSHLVVLVLILVPKTIAEPSCHGPMRHWRLGHIQWYEVRSPSLKEVLYVTTSSLYSLPGMSTV